MSASTVTAAFVDQLRALEFQSLPPEVVEVARQVVLDGLACAFAGSVEPLGVGRISTAYVRDMGGAPQASVINGGFKTSMPNAAYVNGTLTNALDFDNSLYPPTHPTSPTLPVVLAIAEHHRLPGTRVIEALVAAIETQARLRRASTGMAIGKGFHKPGVIGMFGAVTAASRMLGLDRDQTLMAFGLAGSRAAGLAVNTGTMTKPSHAGNAARFGVECAILARMGWTASADVFGPKGFFDTFMAGHADSGVLTRDYGMQLLMLDPGVGFKAFPCNYFTHRPIEAALALRDEFGITPEQIENVTVVFPPFDYVNRPRPRDGLDGKFSVQYTTALALLDGEIHANSFTNERLHAADVAALMPKIRFQVDDAIPLDKITMHVVVTIGLKDGRELTRRVDRLLGWPGKAGNALSRGQRHRKFFSCTRGVVAEDSAQRLLEQVERLETLPDVSEIMDISRCQGAR
jgi:aconitate decarboxylase